MTSKVIAFKDQKYQIDVSEAYLQKHKNSYLIFKISQ